MFWKKGTDYRGVVAPLGETTRWEVARANPRVTNSNADTRNDAQGVEILLQGRAETTFSDVDNESARNG